MNGINLEHPPLDRLAAFGLGKLTDAEFAQIEAHIACCVACCERLRHLPTDKLVQLVRGAEDRSLTEESLSALSDETSAPRAIPEVLAAHPRYDVEGPVGAGGMGDVFKARHRLMQRAVALKVISTRRMHRATAVERFQREVRAAAQLSHPNIVTAFDAEQAGSTHFLVMEFIEGTSLDRLVAERGPLAVDRACDYIEQAALGLQHAYEHGMVHRDIKPQNLMLTPKGQVKILDFGLARFLSESDPLVQPLAPVTLAAELTGEELFMAPVMAEPVEGDSAPTCFETPAPDAMNQGKEGRPLLGNDEPLTRLGAIMGSPDYVAPEQILDAHTADIRADIYSLGCTLYFLLAGHPPFSGSVHDKLRAHERKQPRPLIQLRRDVPTGLAAVLDRMLAKDPAQRYQTPAEAADALRTFAASPVNRYRYKITTVAIVLLIVSGLAVWQTEWGAGLLGLMGNRGAVVESEDIRTLSSGADGTRCMWGHTSGEGVWGVAFLPDGSRALSCGDDGYVRQWDVASGEELRASACQLQGSALRDVAVSPDGRTALVAVFDSTVRVLDIDTAKELRRFEGHKAKVHGATFSSDGRLALSASGTSFPYREQDNSIRLWEVATGKEIRQFQGHQGWVRTAVFSPNDRYVLSASLDRTVRLWDAETGEEVRRFIGHDEGVLGAVFSPDGRQALSTSWDKTMRLWEVTTGKELRRFQGCTATIESVVFSSDGCRALSAGKDGMVRLWDVATGKELLEMKGHVGMVHAAVLSRDGKFALSGGRDGSVRLWRLPAPTTLAK